MGGLPAGLADAIEAWVHSTDAELEIGPQALSTMLARRAMAGYGYQGQVISHPAPRLRWQRGDEVMVQLQTRRVVRVRQPDAGQEHSSECTLHGAVWRMTEHGWRAIDSRHGGRSASRWASLATCLWPGKQVGEIVGIRQVQVSTLHGRSVWYELSNTCDAPATIGCGCRRVFQAATGSASGEHGHYQFDVPTGGRRIVCIGTGTPIDRHYMAAWRPGLESPVQVAVQIRWHHRPFARRGWCRHSINAQ